MSQALIDSLLALGSYQVVAWIIAGTVLGYWVGILPGVGGIVTMALLLPLTLALEPFEALGLLLSMYAVISITGDLTAILIGVPGSPSSAPMVLDGYGLAKRGRATLAMSAAVISSLLGALIGALILLLTIPVMRPLVLALGSAEVFMLTVLGMAMVSSLSGRSLIKGLATGALGLLLASVGPAVGVGTMRFTFGQLYLLDGIGLVPLAIGLFALPELIDIHRSRSSIARKRAQALSPGASRPDGAFCAWGEVVRRRWLVLRASIIGVVVGVIPGLGGAVASWMAYGHAAQTSKDPEFGTASLDGVVGPGAANNSKEGGGLIPTIAFGVPGTAMMAVLLGALVMLGIQPGPSMVERNLDLSYFMVWVLVIGNILGAGMAFLTLRHLARITFVKGTFLVPFIAAFVIIGAGAASRQTGDLVAVTAFGLLAYLLRANGWPVVPLLLGFVLGPRMESSLNLAVRLHGASWLTNPIVLVLIAATLGTIFAAYRSSLRRGVEGRPTTAGTGDDPVSSNALDVGLAVSFLAVGVVAAWYAMRWGTQAKLMPVGSAAALAILALLVLLMRWIGARRFGGRAGSVLPMSSPAEPGQARDLVGQTDPASLGDVESMPSVGATTPSVPVRKVRETLGHDIALGMTVTTGAPTEQETQGSPLTLIAFFTGFVVATWLVGMTLALPALTFGYYRAVARVSTQRALLVAGVAAALYWLVFEYVIGVPSVRPVLF